MEIELSHAHTPTFNVYFTHNTNTGDPNSWGQLIGGTSRKHGRDKGFTDSTHIAGQAIRMNPSCVLEMVCGNQTTQLYSYSNVTIYGKSAHYESCHTAPFARCSDAAPWTPLWNLHVHSKHTQDYISKPCACPGKRT